jgi:hypothetical protein
LGVLDERVGRVRIVTGAAVEGRGGGLAVTISEMRARRSTGAAVVEASGGLGGCDRRDLGVV